MFKWAGNDLKTRLQWPMRTLSFFGFEWAATRWDDDQTVSQSVRGLTVQMDSSGRPGSRQTLLSLRRGSDSRTSRGEVLAVLEAKETIDAAFCGIDGKISHTSAATSVHKDDSFTRTHTY